MDTTQITVRIPTDLVAFVDRLVAQGIAESRAEVVRRGLWRYERELEHEREYLALLDDPMRDLQEIGADLGRIANRFDDADDVWPEQRS